MKTPISKSEIENILRKHDEGGTLIGISRDTGRNVCSVRKILRNEGRCSDTRARDARENIRRVRHPRVGFFVGSMRRDLTKQQLKWLRKNTPDGASAWSFIGALINDAIAEDAQ